VNNQSQYLLPRLVLLTLLALWPPVLISAQEPAKSQPARVETKRKAISYAFVSPNTRENLTLKEAIAGLSSFDEKRLIDEARRVACRLHLSWHVRKAVGSWTDGAENSTLIHLNTDQATVRYAASWLGKFASQKSVLYFRRSFFGQSRMYVLLLTRGDRDIAAVAAELDLDGIANRILVPRKKRMLIYIVDLKNELEEKVSTAARRLHARLSSIAGAGEFIGDENDRDKAQRIYEQEIRDYEVAHPAVRRTCRKKTSTAWIRSTSTRKGRTTVSSAFSAHGAGDLSLTPLRILS
jgi:hypothetical protein